MAGAVGLIGLAVAVWIAYTLLFGPLLSDLTPLDAPGQVSINLDSGAERTIYIQTKDSGGRIATAEDAAIRARSARQAAGPWS